MKSQTERLRAHNEGSAEFIKVHKEIFFKEGDKEYELRMAYLLTNNELNALKFLLNVVAEYVENKENSRVKLVDEPNYFTSTIEVDANYIEESTKLNRNELSEVFDVLSEIYSICFHVENNMAIDLESFYLAFSDGENIYNADANTYTITIHKEMKKHARKMLEAISE